MDQSLLPVGFLERREQNGIYERCSAQLSNVIHSCSNAQEKPAVLSVEVLEKCMKELRRQEFQNSELAQAQYCGVTKKQWDEIENEFPEFKDAPTPYIDPINGHYMRKWLGKIWFVRKPPRMTQTNDNSGVTENLG